MTDEAPTLPAVPHTIRGDNRTVTLVMPRVSGGRRASAGDASRGERSHDRRTSSRRSWSPADARASLNASRLHFVLR
jgi:hypothetical protein